MLIDPEVLDQIRHGVCGVGYATVPLEQLRSDPTRPYFKTLGTGFLVEADLVMTNRHVIQGLYARQAELGFPDTQFAAVFVYPVAPGKWAQQFCRLLGVGTLTERHEQDVGFLRLRTHVEPCKPLRMQDGCKFMVGEPVGVCGYAYGFELLHDKARVRRFGPVVHQGTVSAVSPYDHAHEPDEILLDVRVVGGMSGSPVFRMGEGTVIGLVYADVWGGSVTGLAVPIWKPATQSWITAFKKNEPRPTPSPY